MRFNPDNNVASLATLRRYCHLPLLSTVLVGYCPGLQRNAITILRDNILPSCPSLLFPNICQYLFLINTFF